MENKSNLEFINDLCIASKIKDKKQLNKSLIAVQKQYCQKIGSNTRKYISILNSDK